MSKVFVVQDTDRNLLPAKEFGTLRVMLTYSDTVLGYEHVLKKLQKEMAGITSKDYLLCIGDPVAIGLAVHVAFMFTNGNISILKWDRVKYEYRKVEIRTNYEYTT